MSGEDKTEVTQPKQIVVGDTEAEANAETKAWAEKRIKYWERVSAVVTPSRTW